MKDIPVELARIFAAATVIGVHTYIGSQVSGEYDFSRILIACLIADGVGVFWMITGFFAFKSEGGGIRQNYYQNNQANTDSNRAFKHYTILLL